MDEPVVGVLEDTFMALARLGEELGDDDWDRPTECPGWSVRDVYSHVIGTERMLLGDPSPDGPAEIPDHVRNPVGAANEAWVAARRGLRGDVVLDELVDVCRGRIAQLRSFGPERFDEVGWSPVGQVPYREFMAVRVMDCWVHEQDARQATGRPGHGAGPAADIALDRLQSAMPFVVGKQAQAPDGASVRLVVGGPSPRQIDVVVVGGRATLGGSVLSTSPTVTLRLGSETFRRLTCGRIAGNRARIEGLVAVHGDERLGAALLDAMAFMI